MPRTFDNLSPLPSSGILSVFSANGRFQTPTEGQREVWDWYNDSTSSSPSSSSANGVSIQRRYPPTLILGSQTGSGKTLAYLLPIVNKCIEKSSSSKFPRSIVVVPNEVLAYQVRSMAVEGVIPSSDDGELGVTIDILPNGIVELNDYRPWRPPSKPSWSDLPDTTTTMGTSTTPPQILITTPSAFSRICQSVKTSIPIFSSLESIVLDEVDLLLTGDNLPHTKKIFQALRALGRLDPALFNEADCSSSSSGGGDGDGDGGSGSGSGSSGLMPKLLCVGATIPTKGVKFSPRGLLSKEYPEAKWIEISGFHESSHAGLVASSSKAAFSPTSSLNSSSNLARNSNSNDYVNWIEVKSDGEKFKLLVKMLTSAASVTKRDGKHEKTIVYVNTAKNADALTDALRDKGGVTEAKAYHAKMPKEDRRCILKEFTEWKRGVEDGCRVLVSTDLSARGLDMPGVTRVIEFEMALDTVAHLHRIGRCGRLGAGLGDEEGKQGETAKEAGLERNFGEAFVFFDPTSKEGDLVSAIREGGGIVDGDGNIAKAFSRKRGFRKKKKKGKVI